MLNMLSNQKPNNPCNFNKGGGQSRVAKFLVMITFKISNLSDLIAPGKEINFSRGFKVIRLAKLLSRMSYLCFIHQKSSQGIYCSQMRMHVFPVHHAVLLCFSMWWEEWLVWFMYWVCSTCTQHPWICHSEVHGSLASMHYDCLMRRNAEFRFAFYLQYSDDLFFSRNSVIHSMCKNTWDFCQSTCVCILFLLILGETNDNLHLLDRARRKRKMKWKSSYINSPNCNLQFCIELPLQIECLGDYSFCVYLNKSNASFKKEKHSNELMYNES